MKRKIYESPMTLKMEVEIEDSFMVASGKDTTIKSENVSIDVEEYSSIENEVVFD